MAMPPVSLNQNSLQLQLEKEFARIDANFQTANFCLSVSTYSGLFTVACLLGVTATDPENGKKRSLYNKIFLGAGIAGVVVIVSSVVASFALAFFQLRSSNKL
jgi:predicted GNAT superfamily acetyltransferase